MTQSMRRPRWVHCIERYRVDEKGKSYCGRDLSMEFKFLSAEHAAYSAAQGLAACVQCVDAIVHLLDEARWSGAKG